MVNIKFSLVLFLQSLAAVAPALDGNLSPETNPDTAPESPACPALTNEQVVITSPSTIKAGQDFSITWTSPKPDPKKEHTEVHVELWAMNAGPVNSPMSSYKSDRLFDVTSYTYNFPTSYVNATTKGGPILWQLFVAVYSTYYDRNFTDLEPWNLPYYGVQRIKFE
jgi:hypothetical protein